MEQVLATVPTAYVYKIPPLTRAAGHKAADWDVMNPMWEGRVVVTSEGSKCTVRLEEEESGELFAEVLVDQTAVTPVTDSSRYFVLRMENAGRKAYVGLGFADRTEAFDFNEALQRHRKYQQQEKEAEEARLRAQSEPEVDYSLKAPIKISVNVGSKSSKKKKEKSKGGDGGGAFLLPPPKAASSSIKNAPASSGSGGGGLFDVDPFAASGSGSSAATATDDPFASSAFPPPSDNSWVPF